MAKKENLIELIERGQAEMKRFAAYLSEEERTRSGSPDDWAPKDILGHITEWKRRMVDRLNAALTGETPKTVQDEQFDSENLAIFEANRNRSLADILAELEAVHPHLLALLAGVSEEMLNDPERFAWLNGRPLWRSLAGNCYLHPLSHIGPYCVEHGDIVYATQMREKEAKLVAALDDSPVWQGIAHYNLACHYALIGEREKAFAELAPALKSYPWLAEWAPEDADLAALHGNAAFQALINDTLRTDKV